MSSLRKTIRGWKQAQMVAKFKSHASDRSFNWRWKDTPINRIAVINWIVGNGDCAYLEIGCDRNEVFHSVPASRKVGVDPNRGGTVRTTSDEFFAGNRDKFDVVFIDGLHTYEQVHKDVANAMRALDKGGWVVLHDLLPHDWIEAHVPRITAGSWTGDVWKVAFELAATDGVEFKIVKVDNGVGVFRLVGEAPELRDDSAILANAQFEYLHANIGDLPLADWAEARGWIASQR